MKITFCVSSLTLSENYLLLVCIKNMYYSKLLLCSAHKLIFLAINTIIMFVEKRDHIQGKYRGDLLMIQECFAASGAEK